MAGRIRQCQGKKAHSTRREAEYAAFLQRDNMRAYRCEYCRRFHIGHPKRARASEPDWMRIEEGLQQGHDVLPECGVALSDKDLSCLSMLQQKYSPQHR